MALGERGTTTMSTPMRIRSTLKQPSAFLPPAMSLVALAMIVVHVTVYGVVRGGDEGTAARIFQLLMLAQVPIIACFVVTQAPRDPKSALGVLVLQAGAWIAALALVVYLEM